MLALGFFHGGEHCVFQRQTVPSLQNKDRKDREKAYTHFIRNGEEEPSHLVLMNKSIINSLREVRGDAASMKTKQDVIKTKNVYLESIRTLRH